jgi:HAD superfamily hydrolase (TIGR01509 family)
MFLAKKLVLFDIDGVLLDSKTNMEAAWHDVQVQLGIRTGFSEYFQLIGRPFRDIIAMLGLSAQVDEIERVYKHSSAIHIEKVEFYPQAISTLCQLDNSGILIGIVTSKDAYRTKKILNLIPQVDFITIQTPNDKYRGKPSPDHLLVAMAEAHVDPADTVYVGDMDSDAEAANRAGVDYIHAAWGYGTTPHTKCAIAKDFSDLIALLKPVETPISK